jgi:hypothetical protein
VTESQKANDASRYLVVAFLETGPLVVGVVSCAGDADKLAEETALENEGFSISVFQKTKTAAVERKVAWKGHAA